MVAGARLRRSESSEKRKLSLGGRRRLFVGNAMENVTVRFTPLSGGHSFDPPAYLLDIGSVRILLDCGWAEPFSPVMLEPLRRVAREVDLVLLSHGDVEHAGALAYARQHFGLTCPVYATTPAKTLGHMAMYDAYLSRRYNGDFDLFGPDSIDEAWEPVTALKYSQHLMLDDKAAGIEITPYAAGHTLGGCIWRIKMGIDEIVYASHYNHTNERHLQKGLMQTLQRPMLLICGATNARIKHENKRGDRDRHLLEAIGAALRSGGNVLLPVDAAGRVLELALLLHHYWVVQRPLGCSLVLLGSVRIV